jgi:hypothetical protein
LKTKQILSISAIALVVIIMGVLIYGPSFAGQELEEEAMAQIEDLLADIPDNQDLYAEAYQQSLPDSLMQPLNRLNAQTSRLAGLAGYMWSRLDSANTRRKNKNHHFLVKQGYADQFGQQLQQADSLMQLLAPDMEAGELIAGATEFKPENLGGHPITAQQYIADWMQRLRKAERGALTACLKK